MNRKTVFIILSASLLFSCIKGKEESQILYGTFTTRVEWADTKTVMNGSAIHFSSDEAMIVKCEGINEFVVSNNGSDDPNVFHGQYKTRGVYSEHSNWYSVYPATLKVTDTGIISGTLPSEQVAPFDPSANLMCSDVVDAWYDEGGMPDVLFAMNQIMGLVRISFVNGNDEYADDILQSVQLRASVPLSGEFDKDIYSSEPVFEEGNSNKYVTSLYSTEETLGVDTQHWVTLFVNPVEISGAELIIRTDQHTFSYVSPHTFTPVVGALTMFQLMDLENFTVEEPRSLKRRIVCWGDSFTSITYPTYVNYLQNFLGDEWEVFNGGISGDRTDEIAARQGGLPVVTGSAFTIPAGTQTIQIDGILKTHDILGNAGFFNLRRFSGAFVNPCKLVGTNGEEVLCNITNTRSISGTDTTYSATLRRVTAGQPVEIAEHTPIETYGARELRDVDLIIIYMGGNGSFGTNRDDDRRVLNDDGWRNLADQHWEMINFTEHPDSYLVLGQHARPSWDRKGFSARMESEFGNRFLNLRLPVVESEETIKYWLLYSGAYAGESEIPREEIDYALAGNWPRPLQHTPTDIHPNEYCAKVFAKIIYDRMVELGYLD